MKKTIKVMLLSVLTIGMIAGCDFGKKSSDSASSGSDAPSSISSSVPSSSSEQASSNSSAAQSNSSSSAISSSGSIAPTLSGIELNTTNVKKDYIVGEKLDLAGLVVNAKYNNNNSVPVLDYTTDPANGTTLNNAGPVTITVTYKNQTATFSVVVKSVTGLTIDTSNVKKTYNEGDELDLTGLVANIALNDSSNKAVTNFVAEPANGTVLATGTTTVTISYAGYSQQFTVAVNTLWAAEKAAVMADNLHGVILPYNDNEGSLVSYDSEYEVVYIRGGVLWEDTLAEYADKMVIAGFESIDDDMYLYQKAVETADGTRYVRVYFGRGDTGEFYLEAYDPYEYEFPTDFAKEIASVFDSTVTPPAFEADYYIASGKYVAIFCYTNSTTAEADYTAILTAANWDVKEEKVDGFFAAESPDGRYQIYYQYDTVARDLDIYFGPLGYWNSALVNQFLAAYNSELNNVPSIDIDGGEYIFTEWSANAAAAYLGYYEMIHAMMTIYGAKDADAARYAGILREAGWSVEVSSKGSYYAKLKIEGKGLARLEFHYDESYKALAITIYTSLDPIPQENMPNDEIAEILGTEVTDTIPAYEGENGGYVLLDDMFGSAITVTVPIETEKAAVAAYKETLKQAGYTEVGEDPDGEMRYLSPNGQIIITVYYATACSFTINFAKAPLFAFPSAQIAEYYGETQDTVPALDGAYSYAMSQVGRITSIACEFANEDEAKAALATYVSALGVANYTVLGEDSHNDIHYDSPNSEFEVCPYVSGRYVYISIMGPDKGPATEWPIDQLKQDFGEKVASKIPAYEGGNTYQILNSGALYEITVGCDDAEAALEEYIEILLNAGFIEAYVDEYDDTHYTSKDGMIDIAPWLEDDNYFDIDIIVNEWIAAGIPEMMANAGFTDILPEYDGSWDEISCGTDYDGSLFVLMMYEDSDDISDAAYDYCMLLNETFEYDSEASDYYNTVFKSPNNQYTVTVSINRIGVALKIKPLETSQGGNLFPMAQVIADIPAAENVLPALDVENATYDYDYYFGEAFVTITFESAEAAANASTAYIAALGDAGFTHEQAWGYLDGYMSSDRKIFVEVTIDANDSTILQIGIIEYVEY